MKTTHYILAAAVALPLMLGSCASKKAAIDANGGTSLQPSGSSATASNAGKHGKTDTGSTAVTATAFMQKVADNKVYATNIVGNMTFSLQAGGKDITVPGSLHMRKDEVIRLQLFIPILGTEVGRLEFTPTYVLVIDRLHKEYIKADYTQVDFLKQNGLTFYSLQALFWNQLFLPGEKQVSESALRKFTPALDAAGTTVPVSLADGKMTFLWNADRTTGCIDEATVSYKSASHGESTLNWRYSDFKAVGVKQFPAQQVFKFTTTATKSKQTMQVSMSLNDVKTTSKWETTTEVSSRYKKIEASDVLQRLLKF